MFPYSLGTLTLLQGLYSLIWIVLLMDVLSPTFDLREADQWSAAQTTLFGGSLLMATFAVGVAMHTLSRNLFRRWRDRWCLQVVASDGVHRRMAGVGPCRASGGPSLDEVRAAEGADQVRKAGEFMHALDYSLQLNAPQMHRSVQLYRDQYRLARAFILPSLMIAIVMPFWEPLPSGHLGSFPLIGIQVVFLGIFFAGVCMYAFRERSYRFTLAQLRAFWTVHNAEPANSAVPAASLSAVK